MTTEDMPAGRALARAGLYRLLALGFAYPDRGVHGEFGRLLSIHCAAEPHGHDLRAVLAGLAGTFQAAKAQTDPADLAGEYLRLFDRTVACSPYESEHSAGVRSFTKARDLADIQGFYAAFGLEPGREAAEMGDHIRVELEFMSVLALKEAYFREEGPDEALEVTIEAQRAFLRDHLGRWVPQFCDRLAREAQQPFYEALAAATRAIVEGEIALLAVEVAPVGIPITADPDGLTVDQFVCPKVEREVQVGRGSQGDGSPSP